MLEVYSNSRQYELRLKTFFAKIDECGRDNRATMADSKVKRTQMSDSCLRSSVCRGHTCCLRKAP